MSYHANVAAVMRLAHRILPRVRAVQPAARLVIVGRDPSPAVRALEHEAAGVTVTGAVADIADHVRRAAVAAVPLVYGAGVQNKVLEAMACETPVVADPLATRALDPSCTDALLTAADDESFAAHILRLFDDDALRARIGAAGRSFVERFHSWDGAAESLEGVYLTSRPNAVHGRGLALARFA
jgi:glycosyltransferase involved in cell wall biosynthesis